MKTIRLALYAEDEPAIISPAYSVIETKDINEFLPKYMMMWFQKPESDRYGWFISDNSVRASLDYDKLCEMEIPIPHIDEQRKYVALYNGILPNQKTYKNSLEDLQLICDTYIEDLIINEPAKTLGTYIQQADERNADLEITFLQGVSTSKKLINSKANTTGVKFNKYKIVRNGQFVYVADISRRGEKIALAMNNAEDCIVLSIYTVFEVIDQSVLIPEYLFLFFKRAEFDRYARFHSWGSARETLDWDDMRSVKLPIPDIKIQKAIVTIYRTLEARKHINEQLKVSIKPICPVLMRGVVVNTVKQKTVAV